MYNSIKYAVIMIEILIYSCNASLMISGLKCSVHSEKRKTRSFAKEWGFANLGDSMYILGKVGFYT